MADTATLTLTREQMARLGEYLGSKLIEAESDPFMPLEGSPQYKKERRDDLEARARAVRTAWTEIQGMELWEDVDQEECAVSDDVEPDWEGIRRHRAEIGSAYTGPSAKAAEIVRYVALGGWGPDAPLLAVTNITRDPEGAGVTIRRVTWHWDPASAPAAWTWENLGPEGGAESLAPEQAREQFPEFVEWAERAVATGPSRIHDSLAFAPIEI